MFNRIEYRKKYYKKNKEKLLKQSKGKYISNKENILKQRKKRLSNQTLEERQVRLNYLKEYRKVNAETIKNKLRQIPQRFKQYEASAKRRRHEFNLTEELFRTLYNADCTYCGKSNSNGVDRINNSIGYTKENSCPCCEICNKMKWKLSEDVFKEQVQKIYQNLFNS